MFRFILFCFCLSLISCSEENGGTLLRYDGDNLSAPLLEEGTHLAAARFPSTLTSTYSGQQLIAVDFYVEQLPTSCSIRIFTNSSNGNEIIELQSQNITGVLRGSSWNQVVLNTPLSIDGQELWIALEVTHNSRLGTIGCDPGPAIDNGDLFLADGTNDWQSFRDFTNQTVNINWNIRGVIE